MTNNLQLKLANKIPGSTCDSNPQRTATENKNMPPSSKDSCQFNKSQSPVPPDQSFAAARTSNIVPIAPNYMNQSYLMQRYIMRLNQQQQQQYYSSLATQNSIEPNRVTKYMNFLNVRKL